MSNVVATEILNQLGGRGFVVMTGARHMITTDNSLRFHIPGTLTKNRINLVIIVLAPSDTYTVEFGVVRGLKYKAISNHTDVYCEDLANLFREHTGLETRMPKFTK